MILDLNFELKNLRGEPLQPESNAGKLLASFLVGISKQEMPQNWDRIDSLKLLYWGMKLYESSKIEIDESDRQKLKSFIDNHPYMNALVAGPLLEKLNVLENKEKRK